METVNKKTAEVEYSDYNVPQVEISGRSMTSVDLSPENIRGYDAVITLVAHREFDLAMIADNAKILVDTKNAAGHLRDRANVIRV